MKIIKPTKLQKGDTIGVVATSFPFPTDESSDYYKRYQKAVKELEVMGFKVKEGKNLRKRKWWFAGTPKERADDINSMFADPEVRAIIVHDGGQSAIAILEHIDYKLVRANPKPFIGFSDITNIHFGLLTQSNLIGFHMGLLTYSLGWVWQDIMPEKKEKGREMFSNILTSDKALGKVPPLTEWECWRPGQAKGRMFGGNLSMLSSLLGTKYFPKLKDLRGCIFFWEIDNTDSYRIERGLYQLKYAGVLDVISGMMIGKLPDIKRTAWEGFEEPTPKEIAMEILKNYEFPILAEVDFGHKTVNIPMPIGLLAEMDSEKLELNFLESAVKS
ncbi:MAG: LD-carboxypeptidase [Candidatus Pacebacteria bacterium]|nr:LD-carboxypeptidase [Candidatus Paceibacterota bacterium]